MESVAVLPRARRIRCNRCWQGASHQIVVPDNEAKAQRVFAIRAAQSERERRSASSLIERMYATRGYQTFGAAHRRTAAPEDLSGQ
ncbi:MAG: hypothetical protein U5L05_16165 [Rubrivivax sp.]|nr:hypothetical protein [Rubrivivax sp.]